MLCLNYYYINELFLKTNQKEIMNNLKLMTSRRNEPFVFLWIALSIRIATSRILFFGAFIKQAFPQKIVR